MHLAEVCREPVPATRFHSPAPDALRAAHIASELPPSSARDQAEETRVLYTGV
jgi:hypothetical protein